MARLFDDASSHKLTIASAPVTAAPCTLACWFKSDDQGAIQMLMAFADSGVNNHYMYLSIRGGSGDKVAAGSGAGAAGDEGQSTTAFTAGLWHHAAAVFTSSTSRSGFIDGGSKGTNTAAVTPSGLNNFAIGVLPRLTSVNYMSGVIAEAGLWNVALDDDEIAALGKGFSPRQIRPQSLIGYWPLFGNDAPELDRWKNRYDLTVTGATKADHPRIYYPSHAMVGHVGVTAPPPVTGDLLLMF